MSRKNTTLIRHEDDNLLIETYLLYGLPTLVQYDKSTQEIFLLGEEVIIHNHTYKVLKRNNGFVTHRAILFPTEIKSECNIASLIAQIKNYIHTYCDVSEEFERIIPYFALLTYVYEDFKEIPYLRVIGDYGSGKTRLLKVVGNICYNAIITSPGTSISAIFRMIEKTAGTLVLDEADFMKSDTTSEIIKLLNNGYAQGNPILRADQEGFEVSVYRTFCPKILGGRGEFQDQATESRCISEIMKRTKRTDIPVNLTEEFEQIATEIRNNLYVFRWKYSGENLKIAGVDGRLNQILNPILTLAKLAENIEDYTKIIEFFEKKQNILNNERKNSLEGIIFAFLKEQEEKNALYVSFAEILQDILFFDNSLHISSRKLGAILKKYGIITERKSSGYAINIFDNKNALKNVYEVFGL